MKVLEWVLAIVLGLLIGVSGVSRLVSSDLRDEMGDYLNLPGWFLVLVSFWEILIAIDLFLPRFRIVGGVGAAVTMVVAAVLNFFGETIDDYNPRTGIPWNVGLAVVGLIVAWLAAGRPGSAGGLIDAARRQLRGQRDEVAEAVADLG
ncbi:MAG: MauE/DoxX family redox-associated membrane protein [Actinomycetota bacterium]